MLWAPNLQLHYPFENQANDYSGNARHGTVFGSGVYATRPNAGRCLYFDGDGDYVATPSFGLSGTVVVFAAWVRCKAHASAYQTLASDYAASGTVGYYTIRRNPASDNLQFQYADGSSPQAIFAVNYFASPWDDVWLHLSIVCDYAGKICYFYRDGLYFTAIALGGTPLFPSTNRVKYFGSYGPHYYFTDGYLQNVQLWTLATMPAAAQMLANVNRLMLGMNPIW